MAQKLVVDHVRMADEAANLKVEWDAMTACIANITKIVNAIPEFWEADTADRYMEQYEELKPGLEEAAQLVSDMADQMLKVSSNFDDADTGMAGQM